MTMKYSILYIHPMFFIEICKYGFKAAKITNNAIPKDARFVRAFCNDNSGWSKIGLVIESEYFKDLKENDTIPILPDVVFEDVQ